MSYVNKPVDYIRNIAKEYSEWYKSSGKQEAQEAGQFWGSVLQNRRYSKSGEQLPITREARRINRDKKK